MANLFLLVDISNLTIHENIYKCQYLGDYSGILYVIECSNGRLYSSYQCQDLIKTIPCIHRSVDIVYLGAHDQYIHAILIQVVL